RTRFGRARRAARSGVPAGDRKVPERAGLDGDDAPARPGACRHAAVRIPDALSEVRRRDEPPRGEGAAGGRPGGGVVGRPGPRRGRRGDALLSGVRRQRLAPRERPRLIFSGFVETDVKTTRTPLPWRDGQGMVWHRGRLEYRHHRALTGRHNPRRGW